MGDVSEVDAVQQRLELALDTLDLGVGGTGDHIGDRDGGCERSNVAHATIGHQDIHIRRTDVDIVMMLFPPMRSIWWLL